MNRDAWTQLITEEVYAVLKRRLGKFKDYMILKQRVRGLLQDHPDDPHMVAAVLLAIAGATSNLFRDTGPINFIHRRDTMGVPDGAWRFMHRGLLAAGGAVFNPDDASRAESTDHWLALWRDAEEAGDFDLQLEAQAKLSELWPEDKVGL